MHQPKLFDQFTDLILRRLDRQPKFHRLLDTIIPAIGAANRSTNLNATCQSTFDQLMSDRLRRFPVVNRCEKLNNGPVYLGC